MQYILLTTEYITNNLNPASGHVLWGVLFPKEYIKNVNIYYYAKMLDIVISNHTLLPIQHLSVLILKYKFA